MIRKITLILIIGYAYIPVLSYSAEGTGTANLSPQNKVATQEAKKTSELKKNIPDTVLLKNLLPGREIGIPEETPIKGVYQVKVGSKFAYLSNDGEFMVIGSLIDLKNGVNLTSQAKSRSIAPQLTTFPEEGGIYYKADGKERMTVTVFSDTSCPYCKKYHKEVPALQKAGVSIRYIPFPRGFDKGPGYKNMLSVWCSQDRNAAMDIAMGVSAGTLNAESCDAGQLLKSGFELGKSVGVEGTPTSFLADGTLVRGYLTANKLLEKIRLNELNNLKKSSTEK